MVDTCHDRPPAPDLADVLAARQRIAPYLRPTPLYRYPALDALAGAQVWVKHENHQPVGAFKVRGGVNLVSQLTADERRRGVITASTGNHGQSVAYAADLFGVRAIICVPEQANPVKVESMRALGAEVVFHGRDFDDAREHCEKLAAEHGYRYIHSGNEPLLIAGVATYTLEILEAQPGHRGDRRPGRRRQRGGRGLRGRQGGPPVDRGDRRAVRGGSGRLPLLAGRRARRGRHRHVRRGAGHPDRVRAAAADPVGAARRLRPGLRGRAAGRDPGDDREDAQPRRAGRRGRPRGGAGAPGRFAGRKVAIVCSGGNISPAQLVELWPRETA